ncbi:MAG TPA: hypothetical protein VIQ31_16560 [Phormidium sp.]
MPNNSDRGATPPEDKPTDMLGQQGSNHDTRNKEDEDRRTQNTGDALADYLRSKGKR